MFHEGKFSLVCLVVCLFILRLRGSYLTIFEQGYMLTFVHITCCTVNKEKTKCRHFLNQVHLIYLNSKFKRNVAMGGRHASCHGCMLPVFWHFYSMLPVFWHFYSMLPVFWHFYTKYSLSCQVVCEALHWICRVQYAYFYS